MRTRLPSTPTSGSVRPPTTSNWSERRPSSVGRGSADAHEVDDEHERLVGTDHAACALLAVGQRRRDRDAPPAADAHAGHALVPTLDDLTGAEAEPERVAAVPRRIELLARPPRHTDVVDLHGLTGNRFVTVTDLDVLDRQLRRRPLARRD